MIRLIERALEVNGGSIGRAGTIGEELDLTESAAAFPLSVVSAARPNLNLEIGVRALGVGRFVLAEPIAMTGGGARAGQALADGDQVAADACPTCAAAWCSESAPTMCYEPGA